MSAAVLLAALLSPFSLALQVPSTETPSTPSVSAPTKPNFFIFVVDDFGWANIGIHRTPGDDPLHEVVTPAMDALAAEGVNLDRNYLFWYCSPSRSSLQTGRNPIHVNVNNDDMSLYNPNEPTTGGYQGIPRNMTGIGSKLSDAGYATHFYGKWHIGLATTDHSPKGRGWQNHMIYFDGGNDYWTSECGGCVDGNKHSMPITDLWKDDAPARGLNNSWDCGQGNQMATCEYEDTFFLNATLDAIKNHDNSTPFFEIWAPHNIHAPLSVPTAYLNKFSFINDTRRQAYAAKVNFIDDALALVVDALKTSGMWDNTLFILTSDNGGPIYDNGYAGASNWPNKGGKTSNWEGGVRGNGIVSGGLLPPSRRGVVETGFVSIEDWYATLCALAGVDKTDTRAAAAGLPPVDSLNLWPMLSGMNSTSPRTEIILGMPFISSDNSFGDPHLGVQALIREDGYKLIIGTTHQNVWTGPQYPNASTKWPNTANDCTNGCLYNVFTDTTEHNDVASTYPDIVTSMRARISELNATMYRPDRGTPSKLACTAALEKWGGFWGPFLD